MAPALRMTRSIKEKLPFFCSSDLPSYHPSSLILKTPSSQYRGFDLWSCQKFGFSTLLFLLPPSHARTPTLTADIRSEQEQKDRSFSLMERVILSAGVMLIFSVSWAPLCGGLCATTCTWARALMPVFLCVIFEIHEFLHYRSRKKTGLYS
jgi:hypothetical protein